MKNRVRNEYESGNYEMSRDRPRGCRRSVSRSWEERGRDQEAAAYVELNQCRGRIY